MRSRYSAYVTGNYQYVLDTYSSKSAATISLKDITESAEGTVWLRLDVEDAPAYANTGSVTFCAIYRDGDQFYRLHEQSFFVRENTHWRYDTGIILKDSGLIKPQRNAPCPCGSGKKFKTCCL